MRSGLRKLLSERVALLCGLQHLFDGTVLLYEAAENERHHANFAYDSSRRQHGTLIPWAGRFALAAAVIASDERVQFVAALFARAHSHVNILE